MSKAFAVSEVRCTFALWRVSRAVGEIRAAVLWDGSALAEGSSGNPRPDEPEPMHQAKQFGKSLERKTIVVQRGGAEIDLGGMIQVSIVQARQR